MAAIDTGAAVGVQGQLVRLDAVSGQRVGDELLGEFAGLGGSDSPAGHVAGVHDLHCFVDLPCSKICSS